MANTNFIIINNKNHFIKMFLKNGWSENKFSQNRQIIWSPNWSYHTGLIKLYVGKLFFIACKFYGHKKKTCSGYKVMTSF